MIDVRVPVGTTPATAASAAPAHVEVPIPQYSARKILAVWASAALPMGALAWIAAPVLAGITGGPSALPRALFAMITLGLAWQFVLTVILVYREQRTLRWSVIREVLWLRAPRSPKTGHRGGRMWLAVPLLMVLFVAAAKIPALPHPAIRDAGVFLASPAGHALLHGSWGWFALIAILSIFNTVLGEELLFRGLLLPRMNRAFGRRDWLANALLFTGYHLQEPWVMSYVLPLGLILAYPSKRYRSSLIGIAVHSSQTVLILAIALALVLK